MERFNILGVLPKESNFATLQIVRDLQKDLSLTEKEHKEFDFKHEENQFKWNEKGSEEREIKIGEKATDIIVEALKELDKSKKITPQILSVYEKFMMKE